MPWKARIQSNVRGTTPRMRPKLSQIWCFLLCSSSWGRGEHRFLYVLLSFSTVIQRFFREADPRNVANWAISTCRNGPATAIIATRKFYIAQISRQTEPSRWPEVRRKLKRFFSCAKRPATTTTQSGESLAEKNSVSKSIARVCGSTLFTVKRRSNSIKAWSAVLVWVSSPSDI